MRAGAALRLEGSLKSWTDDRGFGFIEPDQGGQEIFVHIKAFPPGTGRPSIVCFVAYLLDKSAARRGARRMPEKTLLMLGLIGGWPGGLLAQQLLRHKSNKPSFRAAFWGSVLLNIAAFTLLASRRFM